MNFHLIPVELPLLGHRHIQFSGVVPINSNQINM